MSVDENQTRLPWQPLTFGGVAALAEAPFSRVLAVQFVVSLLAAASVVVCFHLAWEPTLQRAISQLPESGAIRNGRLEWPDGIPTRLAEGTFLSIVVDPTGTGPMGLAADLQVELTETRFRVRSLFGYLPIHYPRSVNVPLNRSELEPWWGAWRPTVFAALAVAVILDLFISWTVLAALYVWPVQFVAFFADRKLAFLGAWRLASASLLPGALLISAAILAYGFRQINLVQLLLAWVLHLALGWIFILVSPFRLPRQNGASQQRGSRNPFQKS